MTHEELLVLRGICKLNGGCDWGGRQQDGTPWGPECVRIPWSGNGGTDSLLNCQNTKKNADSEMRSTSTNLKHVTYTCARCKRVACWYCYEVWHE